MRPHRSIAPDPPAGPRSSRCGRCWSAAVRRASAAFAAVAAALALAGQGPVGVAGKADAVGAAVTATTAWSASNRAEAEARAGDLAAAAVLWRQLVRVYARPADVSQANAEAIWWTRLAAYDARRGDSAAAFRAIGQEASYYVQAGNRAAATWALEQDARSEARAGRTAYAAADWKRLIALYARTTDRNEANNVALWWRDLRALDLAAHRQEAAQQAFVEELRYFTLAGQRDTVTWMLEQQAEQSVQAGDLKQAAWDWARLIPIYAHPADANQANDEALFYRRLGRYLLSQHQYAAAAADFALEAQYWKAADRAAWGDLDHQVAWTIRPVLQVYAAVPTPQTATAPAARFAPPWGTYVGFYAQRDPGIGNAADRIAVTYGRKPAILLYYLDWGQPLPAGDVAAARQLGAALEIALQPQEGLAPVLAGGDYLRALVRACAQARLPIFLRFAGEMNGDWTAWGANPRPGDPTFDAHAAQYVAAFREVAAAMHAGAPNVAMVWAPNDMPQTGTQAYYPGDAYVDWVGVSAYLPHSLLGARDSGAAGHWLDLLTWIVRTYPDKPVMVTEGAVTHYDQVTGADVSTWAEAKIREFFADLPLVEPQVKAVVYWSSRDATSDYALSDDAAVARALDAATASPWYLDRVGASAPVRYVPLADGAAVRAGILLETFAQNGAGVGAVRYALDGRPFATTGTPPYAVRLATAGPGMHTLTVVALSPQGRPLQRLAVRLSFS